MILLSQPVVTPPAGWSLITHADGGTPGYTMTSAALDTTDADLLVVLTQSYSNAGTLSDNKDNTWILGANIAGRSHIYYCQGGVVGTGHTFSLVGANYATFKIQAFKGSAVNPRDQTNAATDSFQPGPLTPTVANCLIVSGVATNGASVTDIDSGFMMLDFVSFGASAMNGASAYLFQTIAATVDLTWSGTAPWASTIMSFKGA